MNNKIFWSILFVSFVAIFISCDKEVSVSGPQDYEIGTAKYFVNSDPKGAAIFVDDRNTGLFTPDTVRWLPTGTHSFALKKEPFLDHTFSDDVINNSVNSTNYSFYSDNKNFGSINFSSTPEGCEIYLNDSLMNFKTPYTLGNLLPNKYLVKYTYPNHWPDSTTIFVRPGERSYVNLELSDTTVWVTYNTSNSDITDNTITDIFVDEQNVIWVGTKHHGIIKITNGNKEFITEENSALPNNIIHRIKKDKNGVVWVGTYVGLAQIRGEVINSFTTNNSILPSNYIADFDFDADGNIWVGTQEGLAKFDGSDWKVYTTSNSSIPADFITSVLVDQNDTLWIGTNQFNTAKFNGINTWTTYQADELLLGDSVADLIVGTNNKIWVGLVSQPTKGKDGGVYYLENDILITIPFNLANRRINRFYMDDNNSVWIGTRSGLLEVESIGNFKLYTAIITGLPINDVIAVSKDKDGNMWIGTNGRGLVKYKMWNE